MKILNSFLLGTAILFAANAWAEVPLTQERDGIKYVTGGIGETERNSLESVQADYNLHIMNSYGDGALSGYVTVTLFDKGGKEILASDAGPIFYGSLKPGKYSVTAKNGEQEQTKKFSISEKKPATVHFVWK